MCATRHLLSSAWRIGRWGAVHGERLGALCACLRCRILGGAAHADESLYIVAKIAVDVTAQDAVAAKAKGMAEAERRALNIVLQRLVPFSVYPKLPDLTREASRPGQQRLDPKRAKLHHALYRDARCQLQRAGGEAAGRQPEHRLQRGARAEAISILPFVIEGSQCEERGRRKAGARPGTILDLVTQLTPATILPAAARSSPLRRSKRCSAGDPGLRPMQGDYGCAPLVIAVAELTAANSSPGWPAPTASAQSITGRATQSTVAMPRMRAQGAAAVAYAHHRESLEVDTGQTPAPTGAYRRGGRSRPRRRKPATPRCRATSRPWSSSPGSRSGRRSAARLTQVPGIQALEVNSLSARAASITFDYAGSLGQLQKELGQSGFVLRTREMRISYSVSDRAGPSDSGSIF